MDQPWSSPRAPERVVLDVPSTARLVGAVLDSLPLAVGLLRVGHGYPIAHCNAILRGWLAPEMHPVVGRPFVDLFDRPSERIRAREILDRVVETGEAVHFRHYETAASTSRRPETTLPGGLQIWTWDLFPIRGHAGSVDYLLSIGLDVTDSALAERRLVDGHEQAVNALMAVVDHAEEKPTVEGFLGALTATVAELVGASRVAFFALEGDALRALGDAHGLDGDDLSRLGTVPCRPGSADLLAQVVHLGQPLNVEAPRRSEPPASLGDGGTFLVRDCVAVPWRAGEQVLGALVAWNSTRTAGFAEQAEWVMQASAIGGALVWRQRQAEAALAAQRELEAEALRVHAERMAALERVKSDFLNLASHELRGPLAVVHGYIGLFLDGGFGPLDPGMTEAMDVVMAKLQEMRRLVDQLVETARLEDRRLELVLVDTDLRALVKDAVATLLPLPASRHRVKLHLPRERVIAPLDRGRMLTVVINLVGNALKYTEGEIDCRLAVAAGQATLTVSDRGPGIDEESVPMLFSRFGRIVTEGNRHVGGTGLGLYLSRELARRHGADITYSAREGGGSVFVLTVPLPG